MAFPVRLLLLGAFLLMETRLSAARVGAQTDHQCRRATRAACVWVSDVDGHHGKAHVGGTCQDPGTECQYDLTCHVAGVSHDIYICKGPHDVANVLRQWRAGVRNRKHSTKPQTKHAAHVHARVRRSAPSEAVPSSEVSSPEVEKGTGQVPAEKSRDGPTGPEQPEQQQEQKQQKLLQQQQQQHQKQQKQKLPTLLAMIIARHRSNNVFAFNGGTYFLNGYNSANSNKAAIPIEVQRTA